MKRLFILLLFIFALCLPSFAAKEIIVLGQNSNGTTVSYNVLFWFAISSGQAPASGSVWTSASAAENTAIQNGSVLEEAHNFSFPVGQDTVTIKAYILQAWIKRNQQIAGVGPAQFNGVFFDSISGWSA